MRLGLISHRICIERMGLAGIDLSLPDLKIGWHSKKARDTYHVFRLR